ncbi:hypothetical protein ACJJIW_09965 [Microbulbifer sp. JMSA004]|uniref:hypothetical protein n=1 Tax=Microbulbifer sp. JMSA004 TaxID=3243370 RepID=UPI004039C331
MNRLGVVLSWGGLVLLALKALGAVSWPWVWVAMPWIVYSSAILGSIQAAKAVDDSYGPMVHELTQRVAELEQQ